MSWSDLQPTIPSLFKGSIPDAHARQPHVERQNITFSFLFQRALLTDKLVVSNREKNLRLKVSLIVIGIGVRHFPVELVRTILVVFFEKARIPGVSFLGGGRVALNHIRTNRKFYPLLGVLFPSKTNKDVKFLFFSLNACVVLSWYYIELSLLACFNHRQQQSHALLGRAQHERRPAFSS